MLDTHRIIITAEALADLEGVASHIRHDSPQNASIVAEKILNAIDSLGSMPGRYRRAGRSRERGSTIRAMLVRPFIVYYRVDDSPAAVYILTIRHGRRRQPRRFK